MRVRSLYILLAVSMVTNAMLIARAAPIDWHRLVHRDQALPPVTSRDHVRGDPAAPVTIVEYSDFQCPFCARFHDVLKAAVTESPGQVRWVYRHLPLSSIHPLAIKAGEAAECAADQGRFWDFADAIYARQERLTDGEFSRIAADLDLRRAAFEACLGDGVRRERVAADVAAFHEGHLAGTPTWFVNGTRRDGVVSLEELRQVIRDAAGPRSDGGMR